MPPALNTISEADVAFCEKVCRIAAANEWTLDLMDTQIGDSIAFQHRDGRRVSGDIFKNQPEALLHACKALLPEIYQHL